MIQLNGIKQSRTIKKKFRPLWLVKANIIEVKDKKKKIISTTDFKEGKYHKSTN